MKKHSEEKETLMHRFLKWRKEHLSERQFILILSFLVGICTAFAALFLKGLIHLIQGVLTDHFDATSANGLYLIYPVIGIFLTMLFIRYVVRDDISHGVTKILYAISQKKARIKRHNMFSSVIASAITIGFGGSVGAEAPIVLTGSAIGSNLGQTFHLERRKLMLLVGCGAAGAIAGIFKAPIAGLVFTIEVLMVDLTMSSLLPLMVSCITAATVSYIFTGMEAMFEFEMDSPFAMERIPHVILLGIICGLVSLYFTRMMNRCENMFRHFAQRPYVKLLIGGLMLSVLIFIFPPLYGEGYDTINLLLNGTTQEEWNTLMNNSFFYGFGDVLLLYLILIVLFKVFASSATNGGGGCGGIFAPSLFLGCITGFVWARISNILALGDISVSENNFALLGMAGLMSGVMHAPLMGIFLIAELTGGFDLFLPLMITSVSAYLTIIAFEPHSIYSTRLAKKGELLTHDKDKAVLTLMKVENVVEKNFETVSPDMELGQLVGVISRAKRNLFPVVDNGGVLLGIVQMDDIRHIMFRQELYRRFTVNRLMTEAPCRLSVNDSMEVVIRKFDDTGAWNLPVDDADGKYLGFVSKSKVFASYRQMLVDFSEE